MCIFKCISDLILQWLQMHNDQNYEPLVFEVTNTTKCAHKMSFCINLTPTWKEEKSREKKYASKINQDFYSHQEVPKTQPQIKLIWFYQALNPWLSIGPSITNLCKTLFLPSNKSRCRGIREGERAPAWNIQCYPRTVFAFISNTKLDKI